MILIYADAEKRKVYDERGEAGVTGEDKDMTDKEGEGGGGCSCCCGAKAFIDQYGYAAFAKMTGQISDDSDDEEDSEDEETRRVLDEEQAYIARIMRQAQNGEGEDEEDEEEEEEEEEDSDEIDDDEEKDEHESSISQRNMNIRPMNGMSVRPIMGNPMNIRPTNGMFVPQMNVRPIYDVNMANRSNNQFTRPIIVNGRQVGTYVRPMVASSQQTMAGTSAGPSPASARPTMAVNPMSAQSKPEESDDIKREAFKRQQVVSDEGAKRFRSEEN